MMKSIKNRDVNGKKVFVRVDFNVPMQDGKITDDFRIKKSFETIEYLQKNGAKIILASHIDVEPANLRPVYEYLGKKLKIVFIEDYYPNTPTELGVALENGEIVLLQNLRKYEGEKANDDVFAKHLASFADIYVNEAFAVSHRNHASVVQILKYIEGYVGFVFEEEIKELSRAFHPEHPFVFVLGGAKFETKLPLMQKFFDLADFVFIGGALANDFFRAKGIQTGMSLLSEGNTKLENFFTNKLILPTDVKVKNGDGIFIKKTDDILPEDYIVDAGPKSMESFSEILRKSKFILWNGPLGNYEKGFKDSTLTLAKNIAESGATSIVGGGDTIASIEELGIKDQFSFISTGGGAMLDFLANETLPGIEALQSNT
jgi:phosphoglycerate kinase